MFSTKVLDKDNSRQIAVINKLIFDNSGKKVIRKIPQEEIYLTQEIRFSDTEHSVETFTESIAKYCKKTNHDEFVLSKDYEFFPTFNQPIKSHRRSIFYLISPSGAGKSVFISKLMEQYNKMFPKNHINYASLNDIKNDDTFDSVSTKTFVDDEFNEKQKVTRQFDLININNNLDVYDDVFKNTLTVYDDLHQNVSNSFSVQDLDPEMTKEKFNKLPLPDQNKLNKLVDHKNKTVTEFMMQTSKNIMMLGRKQIINFVFTQHNFFSGSRLENIMLSEATNLVFFIKRTDPSILNRFLTQKVYLTKEQSEKIIKRKYYNFDFVSLDISSSQRFFFSPDSLVFL